MSGIKKAPQAIAKREKGGCQMGFFDLFSRKGRDLINARFEYDEMRKKRQQTLISLREKAYGNFTFKYPDCKVLMNRLDARFMVLVPSIGRLLLGKFADKYYPKLDLVEGDSKNPEEFEKATKILGIIPLTQVCPSSTKGHEPEQSTPVFRPRLLRPLPGR